MSTTHTTRKVETTTATPGLLAELVTIELRKLIEATGKAALTNAEQVALLTRAITEVADTVAGATGVAAEQLTELALQGLRGR